MMQVDYKAFGRRLREYRHARNLTQEKLSELVGVSFQHIGMLERGKRSPSMEMLISLCYALDYTCDALFRILCPSRTSAFSSAPPHSAQHTEQLGAGQSAG